MSRVELLIILVVVTVSEMGTRQERDVTIKHRNLVGVPVTLFCNSEQEYEQRDQAPMYIYIIIIYK